MKYEGIARCKMKASSWDSNNTIPDLIPGCTWKRGPHGLKVPTPDPSAPECMVEFTTDGDRLTELQAHDGVLYIFEYIEEGAEE
jgi:hypothetical protein